jgi:hypothetical protein
MFNKPITNAAINAAPKPATKVPGIIKETSIIAKAAANQ